VNVKKRKVSPVTASVLVGAGAVLVLTIGMFALVLPQRHKAASLETEIEATQLQIADARIAAAVKPPTPIRVADLFKLVKAMPDKVDMPGLLLQLDQTAGDSGIVFDSITPQGVAPVTGFAKAPINLEFTGNFYDLNDFIYRLRNLVAVRGGTLYARGRLFSVASIEFSEGAGGFPNIAAKLTIDAYVYGTGVPGTTAPPPAPTETTPAAPAEGTDALASGVGG
jgi:type IV pilus assembly PilO-like protein